MYLFLVIDDFCLNMSNNGKMYYIFFGVLFYLLMCSCWYDKILDGIGIFVENFFNVWDEVYLFVLLMKYS